jgi:hypothetical protein
MPFATNEEIRARAITLIEQLRESALPMDIDSFQAALFSSFRTAVVGLATRAARAAIYGRVSTKTLLDLEAVYSTAERLLFDELVLRKPIKGVAA